MKPIREANGRKSGRITGSSNASMMNKKHKERGYPNSHFRKKEVQDELRERAKTPHSIEKRKQAYETIAHQQGDKNSQYGLMWITNENENRKIKKNSQIPEGWKAGRKIKKSP